MNTNGLTERTLDTFVFFPAPDKINRAAPKQGNRALKPGNRVDSSKKSIEKTINDKPHQLINSLKMMGKFFKESKAIAKMPPSNIS